MTIDIYNYIERDLRVLIYIYISLSQIHIPYICVHTDKHTHI